jgi:hypothetical protein
MLSLAGVMAIAGLQMTPSLDPTAANAAAATAASFCADFSVSPSGLAFCDSSPGSGIQASKGMLIKAHYTGKLESGQVFDSSYNRGKPLTFRIGVGEVISGWDQGILGTDGIPPMLAGGKRTLRIPPQLAYGERGAGCRLGKWWTNFELKCLTEIRIMSMVVVTDLYVLSKFACCCRESLSSCTDMFLSI